MTAGDTCTFPPFGFVRMAPFAFQYPARIVFGVAALLALSVVDAHAIVVKDAQVSGGVVKVSGSQAVPFAPIVWEGVEVATANRRGAFSFSSTVLPMDCVGTLTDGTSTVDVTLASCFGVTTGLPATGQTTSFAIGDDGAIRAGAALNYTDNGDGTVTDNNTGLVWEKKTDANVNLNFTWQGALDYVAELNAMNGGAGFAGHNDWRLPNMRELLSIVDYSRSNPSIHPVFGPTKGVLNFVAYWSSTSWAAFFPESNAWAVDFADGYGNPGGTLAFGKSSALRVRAVRGGL